MGFKFYKLYLFMESIFKIINNIIINKPANKFLSNNILFCR